MNGHDINLEFLMMMMKSVHYIHTDRIRAFIVVSVSTACSELVCFTAACCLMIVAVRIVTGMRKVISIDPLQRMIPESLGDM